MELLTEDQLQAGSGATPNATAGTGAKTIWLMATAVFAGAQQGTATVPGAPTGVSASPGDGTATVSWTSPNDGGSPISSYTITPYIGSSAQIPTIVTGAPTSATINGLTNGTTYTFTVGAMPQSVMSMVPAGGSPGGASPSAGSQLPPVREVNTRSHDR